MAATLIEQLQHAWLVLSAEGRSLALMSPVHAEGVVAPLYTDRAAAEQAAGYYPQAGDFQPAPLPDLWEAARLLAAQGFAGMILDETIPLFFVTTRPGSALPTHVAAPQADDFLVLDEEGETSLGKADVELWVDLPAFDRLSTRWMLGDAIPFVGYQPDMALWEYRPGGAAQPVAERGALLPEENRSSRALLLFSEDFAAEWYWQGLLATVGGAERPVGEEIVALPDVVARLEALHRPDRALLLNPGRHRFFQGFFRKAQDDWYLLTINGIWLVQASFRCTQVARQRA